MFLFKFKLITNEFIVKQFKDIGYYRLYKEERTDGSNSSVKWSCPNIHDLTNILEYIQIDTILDTVVDKRLTPLVKLPVIQLRDECCKLNLNSKGRKVCSLY